jgi:prevent-host-death family protein
MITQHDNKSIHENMDKRITNLKSGVKRLLTHFSELLQRVRRGERIPIIHHGIPAARLVSAAPAPSEPVQEVIEDIKAFRHDILPS